MRVKTQNKLLIELLVKHQLYDELRAFKEQLKGSERMSNKEKWLRIKQLINKEK